MHSRNRSRQFRSCGSTHTTIHSLEHVSRVTRMAAPQRLIVEVGPARPATADKPATGPAYKYYKSKDGNPSLPGVTTLYELFSNSVKTYPNNPCLGRRTADGYSFLTYAETGEQVAAIGAALKHAGVQPHGRCGVYGSNSGGFVWTCGSECVVLVPIHPAVTVRPRLSWIT